MSWTTTHERWGALAEAIAEIERDDDGTLPWNPHLAEVFVDRDDLLNALRYRMRLILEAQDAVPPAELALRHGPVLRVLRAAEQGRAARTPRLELAKRSIA